MIDVNKLKGKMAEKDITGKDMAKVIHKTPKTFYAKMKIGKFDSDEMIAISNALGLENPGVIFFTGEVTQ